MSGHSKWNSIKHKKAAADAKRGNIFTKLSKAITVAAREMGGDIKTNFKLKLAIDKARSSNMPKDNIARAIKKGTGELGGENIEQIMYEAFGPEGSAILIEAVTDNKNRSVANIKAILNKQGGAMAGVNSVLWMFSRKGFLLIKKESFGGKLQDDIELLLIDSGAEDIAYQDDEKKYNVICGVDDLKKIQDYLESRHIKIEEVSIEYVPKETKKLSAKGSKILENIFTALDTDDDVVNYFSNVDV